MQTWKWLRTSPRTLAARTAARRYTVITVEEAVVAAAAVENTKAPFLQIGLPLRNISTNTNKTLHPLTGTGRGSHLLPHQAGVDGEVTSGIMVTTARTSHRQWRTNTQGHTINNSRLGGILPLLLSLPPVGSHMVHRSLAGDNPRRQCRMVAEATITRISRRLEMIGTDLVMEVVTGTVETGTVETREETTAAGVGAQAEVEGTEEVVAAETVVEEVTITQEVISGGDNSLPYELTLRILIFCLCGGYLEGWFKR